MKSLGSFGRSFGHNVQRGFTIVELLIVIAVVGILVALATPFIRGVIIEGRVQPSASDLIAVTNAMRASASANGTATPYTTLGAAANATAVFANTARTKGASISVTGAGPTATAAHNMGATNSQITVAVNTIAVAGDSFTVQYATVNKAACPGFAAIMSKSADRIAINGTVVRDAIAGTAYNGSLAENSCTADDSNTYVFTFR